MTAQALATNAPEMRASAPQQFTSAATIQELGWWMPLFLFIAGWITFLFRNSNVAFEIAMVIGTVVVLRSIYLLVVECRDVRFTWVTSCGLLLGYALGSLNTALQLNKTHETIAAHFFRPQDDLSYAMSLVLWVSATLFLAGAIVETPIRLNRAKLIKSDISYAYLGILIYVGALLTGQIGYMGASVSDEGHVTILGTISGMIGPTLPAITALLRNKSKLLRKSLPFWSVLVLEMALLVPLGRRVIIYSLLCVIFAFTLIGSRWTIALWKKALVLLICMFGLYCVNVVFFAMRYSAEISGNAGKMGARDMSLGDMVTAALKFIREGRDESFDQEMANNLRDRTFVLRYFSELIAQSHTHTPLHGGLVLFSVEMATPSAIFSLFGSKDSVIALGMEEMVANPSFGLVAQDEANSLLTSGVSDWGVWGAFLYPVAIALLMNFFVRVGMSRVSELMRFVVMMMFLWTLFQTELAVTGVIVGLRNMVILCLGWAPVNLAMRFLMKSPNRVPNELDGRRPPRGAVLVRYEAVPRARCTLCDRLIVAVNSDESVRSYKNPLRPIVKQEFRMNVIAALRCVDAVTLMTDTRPAPLIGLLRPDIYIKGGDYQVSQLKSAPLVESYGGTCAVIPVNHEISTSAIVKRIQELSLYAAPEQPTAGAFGS